MGYAAFLGGGGASEMRVYAAASVGALPASASDGDIGIITASAIASVYVDNDALASPAEGMVRIETTVATTAPVALTDKIKLYPWRATQYLSSAWVGKDMRVRYGGAWVSPSAYMYYLSNEYVAFTGGWQARGWAAASGVYAMATVSLTKNADHMLLAGSGTEYGCFVAEIINNIDLTSYATLTAVINNTAINTYNSANNTVKLIVVSRAQSYWMTSAAASVNFYDTLNSNQTKSIDVTGLNGSYDIVIGVYNARTAGCQVKIVDVRLAA